MYQNFISSDTQIALANAVKIQRNFSPEYLKLVQTMQNFTSSPAYQTMLNFENSNALRNINLTELEQAQKNFNLAFSNQNVLQATIFNEKFLKSAITVQDAAIDFLSEMKKIDGYQQKTLGEILKEIRRKKKLEDLPEEAQESFLTLEEFLKIFWKENKENILGIVATSDSTMNAIQNNDFSNIFTILLFVYYSIMLLINCKNFEVNNEN